MRLLIFNVLFLFCISVKGQTTYSYVGLGDEKYVLKEYQKATSKKENLSNGYVMSYEKKGDTLIIKIDGPSKVIRKLTFKMDDKYCDFDQISMLSCDTCTKYQIETVLGDKLRKWRKISDNKYLSKWSYNTELTINNHPEGHCTIMTFKWADLNKDEYEKLYKN
ncbi:MAG: hypothetical protein ACXVPU_10080 [Bacteroidia bacterium]